MRFTGLFLLVLSAATIAASVEDGQKQIESADEVASASDVEGAESAMQEDLAQSPSQRVERQWKVKPVKKSIPGGRRVTVHIVETGGGGGTKKNAKGPAKAPQKKQQQHKNAQTTTTTPSTPVSSTNKVKGGGSHRIDSQTHSEEIHEIILPAEQELITGHSERLVHFPKYEIIAADAESQESRREEPREKIKIKHHHHHHHHNHVKTVVKKVPVEIPVEKLVHVPVEKLVHVPKPYPVEKLVEKVVHVPVEKIVHVPKPVPVEKIVEKVIHVPIPKIIEKPVPYEKIVEKIVHVPKIVEREKKVPVEIKVPYPVERVIHIPKPYPVEKIVEKVVQIPIPKPYPVVKHVHVPVEVKVPVPVHKPVPVPVERKIRVPVRVEKKVKVPVPFPVKVEIEKKIPVPYPVKIPVKVYIPQPYPVEKKVEVKVKDYTQGPSSHKSTYHKDTSYLRDPYPKETSYPKDIYPKEQYPKESYPKDSYIKDTYKQSSSEDYSPHHSYTYYQPTQSTHDQTPYGTDDSYPLYSHPPPPSQPAEHIYSVESAYTVPTYSNDYQKQDSFFDNAQARIQPISLPDSDASATEHGQQFTMAVAPPQDATGFQINVPDPSSQVDPMGFTGGDTVPQYDAAFQPLHLLHLHPSDDFHGISPEATGFSIAAQE
uniref:Putative rna polymerase ii degradation factor 1 n=1 Tax=Lutzomyia longipalpis TaxID=7200 RepID=A0A1B0CHP2_LUTLO